MSAGSWYCRECSATRDQEPAMPLNPASSSMSSPGCGQSCCTRRRRYPSDTTDAQWAVLEPLLPVPYTCTSLGGRPEKHARRSIVDALFYLADNGVKWRALPGDFPPWRTVYGYLARWNADLVLDDLVDALRAACRRGAGRRDTPTAGVIDAQSVPRTAEATVDRATSGYDPHKRVNGRKRHLVVDTLGLLVDLTVTAANIQDRDAALDLLPAATGRGLTHLWADAAYHGATLHQTATTHGLTIQVVPRPHPGNGFHVLPRRWVVERSIAWYTRRRRCARDYERTPQHHRAMVQTAAALTMTRRLARLPKPTP